MVEYTRRKTIVTEVKAIRVPDSWELLRKRKHCGVEMLSLSSSLLFSEIKKID